MWFVFFQAEDGIRDFHVTGVQTCALPISGEPGVAVFGRKSHTAPRSGARLPATVSAGNRLRVRFANATSESITGTSTSTPTTVASAAPERTPKRLTATATAAPEKLGGPIRRR